MTTQKLAVRHRCAAISITPGIHVKGSGKGPSVCPFCGAEVVQVWGRYYVLPWTPTGRYTPATALGVRLTETGAQRLRLRLMEKDEETNMLVVRFLRDESAEKKIVSDAIPPRDRWADDSR